jgi:5-methylcytosine-specific restriction endonuclease McrA
MNTYVQLLVEAENCNDRKTAIKLINRATEMLNRIKTAAATVESSKQVLASE